MSKLVFKSTSSREIAEPTVNLTPLIDVVFVILIMFIVVAPLLELDRVDLAGTNTDPLDAPITVQESSPISIHVRKNNTILLNNQVVSIEALSSLLKQAKKRYPKATPQLYHDKNASFGTYQSVKNAAESAGFQQMDVILKPS